MDIIKGLEQIEVKQNDGFVELTMPLVLDCGCTLLTLNIYETAEGYRVLCPLDIFEEANGTQRRYFDIYEKHDKSYHFQMKLNESDLVYKDYPYDYNPICAVNEFIRFYAAFDEFILEKCVIGNEEAFEA